MHQSGEPGQVLTGAALLRATDVYGIAGLRSEVTNLGMDEGTTAVARHFCVLKGSSLDFHAGDDVFREIEKDL